jgi:peptidoglycan/LPS O-acetylase OafA/YrhL
VILGSLLGLLGLLYDPFASSSGVYHIGKLILLFLGSMLLIPLPLMEARGFNLFGLNAPSWSLFWEYIANLFYAFILYNIGRRYLAALTILAAAVLCFASYRAGNLMGGWAGVNFWDGGARIAYSFLAGLVIFRSGLILKNKLGFLGLSVLLSLAFLIPHFKWNWLVEALVVVLYFPLIVSLGAGTILSPKLKNLCVFSGKISYPLYMTHYAAIWMFANYYTTYKPGTNTLPFIVIVGTIFLVGIAYLAMVFYDIPIRRYLNTLRQKRLIS